MSSDTMAPDFPDLSYDQLLRRAAECYPDRPAIIYHHQILTYSEVVALVNQIANGLDDLGLRKGDCLCLYMTNQPEYTLTFIAAASLGIIISPMNPSYKEWEVGYQLENAEARAILLQEELVPILAAVLANKQLPCLKYILTLDDRDGTALAGPYSLWLKPGANGDTELSRLPQVIPFSRILQNSSAKQLKRVSITGEDLLALPYSSGTTGCPKGVMLTHRNLTANHWQLMRFLKLGPDDRALLFLPFYHIYGVILTGSFLACGGTQVIMERFDLEQSLELCETYAITHYFAVPPIINILAHTTLDLAKMKSVKYIFSGAAPLSPGLISRLQAKAKAIVSQAYGLTEASPFTHAQPQDPALIRPGSIGLPAPYTKQKIVDLETGEQELPISEDGELIIRGPQVMKGYWKAPEETARALRNGWLYTGDVGHIDADGYAYLVDRKKEMIKYKGFGVAPAELEAVLHEHPAVRDAAVIGIPDEEVGELIKGFVVLHEGQQTSPQEIITFTNDRLAGYKRLHVIEFIDAIPRNEAGKILRRKLKEMS